MYLPVCIGIDPLEDQSINGKSIKKIGFEGVN
jgi:hypothetical protein